jgi:5'-nucleotidase
MTDRPLVLLSNDDGVGAGGLRKVLALLREVADVVVCAPASNQSASSHSLTLHRVLRLAQHGDGVFAVDGTPADCVYVALHAGSRVLPRTPDLCVSGMNHGLNLGVDVFYSGTVAAAREAALRGIPSVALSADPRADLEGASSLGVRLALELLARARSDAAQPRLFNVNFPPGDSWRCAATTLGKRTYDGEVVFRKDPRGADYLWIGGTGVTHHESPGSDTEAYDAGVVGVTPLALSLFEPAGMPVASAAAAAVAAKP